MKGFGQVRYVSLGTIDTNRVCRIAASYEGSFGAQAGFKGKFWKVITLGAKLDLGSVRIGHDGASGGGYAKYTQGISVSIKVCVELGSE